MKAHVYLRHCWRVAARRAIPWMLLAVAVVLLVPGVAFADTGDCNVRHEIAAPKMVDKVRASASVLVGGTLAAGCED